MAWRFLTQLSERDAVEFCLYELPAKQPEEPSEEHNGAPGPCDSEQNEHSSLLPQFRAQDPPAPIRLAPKKDDLLRSISHIGTFSLLTDRDEEEEDPTNSFTGLNGLEIAAVADCKRFLSQRIVQKIVTGIWNGDIVFWDTLNSQTRKKPQFYRRSHDNFARLRVPRYIKAFEIVFFATFLFLYYAVLVERNP